MPDLNHFLGRWYAATIGREDKDKVLSDFRAAAEQDAGLITAATSRRAEIAKLKRGDPQLKRDHISKVQDDFLEKIG